MLEIFWMLEMHVVQFHKIQCHEYQIPLYQNIQVSIAQVFLTFVMLVCISILFGMYGQLPPYSLMLRSHYATFLCVSMRFHTIVKSYEHVWARTDTYRAVGGHRMQAHVVELGRAWVLVYFYSRMTSKAEPKKSKHVCFLGAIFQAVVLGSY